MEDSLVYAQAQDEADELRHYRSQFYFPSEAGKDRVYFCGNSLGLQPVGAASKVNRVLESWKEYAVDGYMKGEAPWMSYGSRFKKPLCSIVGCRETEVSVMNSLTVNLHLLLCSFYKPSKERYKIIIEAGAFPSDQYAAETQARYHGLDPEIAIIEVRPGEGEHCIREEDLLASIEAAGSQLSLVLLGCLS